MPFFAMKNHLYHLKKYFCNYFFTIHSLHDSLSPLNSVKIPPLYRHKQVSLWQRTPLHQRLCTTSRAKLENNLDI